MRMTRKQAIRQKCIECSGGVKAEVRRCGVVDCPLWVYRMGKESKVMSENSEICDVSDDFDIDMNKLP